MLTLPYIAIQSFPKDERTKQKVVERINQVFLEEWGCKPEAITISLEEISPEEWTAKVVESKMKENQEHMVISNGKNVFK